MNNNKIEDVYELSPLQQGILFHSIYNPSSESYFQQLNFRIAGKLDEELYRQSWQAVLDRHTILRSSFHWEGLDKPVQVVRTGVVIPWKKLDWSGLSPEEQEAGIETFLPDERKQGFDLDATPVMRCTLIRLNERDHLFVWNYHHLLLDGWCLPLLLREVFSGYLAASKQMPMVFPPVKNYREYILWLQQQGPDEALAYWERELRTLSNPGALSPYVQEGSRSAADGVEHYTVTETAAGKEVTEQLMRKAREHRVTLSTIIQAAWAITLSHYCRSGDILFGYTVSGRSHSVAGAENMIGLFINTLPVRTAVHGEMEWVSWLKELQDKQMEREKYAHVSLADILGRSGLPKNSRFPETIIAFENYPIDKSLEGDIGDLSVSGIGFFEQTNFPITLIISPGEQIAIKCIYNDGLYDGGQIGRLLQHFKNLLADIAVKSPQSISDLSLLDAAERQTWLYGWNDREKAFPGQDACIHRLFEDQVLRTSGDIAIMYGDQEISYEELNNRANQLSHYLREKGVGPGQVTGICLELSVDLLVSVLAVLKTGAAYLPMDTAYPRERLRFIVEDAGCGLLITEERLSSLFDGVGFGGAGTEILMPGAIRETLLRYSKENGRYAVDPDMAGYVIYTSGSSGVPKGVVIGHRSIVNYISWGAATYLRGRKLAFPLYTSIAFDLTVTSVFMPLVTGNSIIIYEGVSRELSIAHILNDDRVGILKLTPSHMKIIREQQVRTTSIRCMIVGGEELETTLAADISASFNDEVEIYNEYGPTEATVGCMIYRYDRYTDVRRSVPVGVPIWNTQIYILQEDLQPAPFGVAGELCISGAGLAREYLNRPELNTSRLTGNPFLRGQRIYRTGDLARFLPDGNIELLGRIDNQVKFNGHRIELGEIEAALSTCPGISNSAVRLLPILQKAADDETIFYCQRCGSPSNYPDISFNARGICNTCESFESYKDKANGYFKSMDDLRALFDNHKTVNQGSYDCLMLLSGGKDSTYVLYQLVRELGLKVLVFSLDNNYISEGAKANMRRVTEDLGVELIFGTTPAMNAIFVDSLKEFSNVCNGCFKTIYTMSLILARQKGIRYIVTGLSRGQLFETRLNDLFCANIFNPTEVDKLVLQSRIAYHKKADVVSENLDSEIFRDETLFEQVEFVDFYRYCDVKLEDMYAYLDRHAPWVRPSDTGRSTNCLINDAGIYIHKKERGYHNYALPYSWDVRMGHKKRDAALHELNDELDMEKIRKILKEIGYDENYRQARGEKQLVAYYAAAEELPVALLRAHLSSRLPAYMMPAVFIRLENMPLTINGKIDYAGLPHPGAAGRQQDMPYIAPRTQTEIQLAGIWKEVLGRDRIGVKDNLFEMGGHSLLMTLLYSRIIRSFGRTISMAELFEYATIEALGQRLDSGREDRSEEEDGSGERARLREERREDVQRKRKLRQEFRTSEEHL